ncbi:MAG: nuclear transport factor 2 family protein, partial [Pyrinomonadaceae bacterium]|nr:nuclear transport factor 2 family protein [Pyrinomonadaceae bacterium]
IGFTVCILLLTVTVFSQNMHPSKTSGSVIKTIQELCKAFETADTDSLRKNMTEDFTLTSSNGSVTSLEDEINDLKSGKARYRVFENVDMKPRLYGNTAVVTGRTIIKGEYDKTAIEMEFQFTDTLIWKNGRWWMVASHASRMKS